MPAVTVKLFAALQKFLPAGSTGRQAVLEIDEGATAGSVLESLGVGRGNAHLVMVNGEQKDWDAPLADGDSMTVFPPVSGG